MTLILTELSKFGIAMAADSALTVPLRKPDGTIGDKVYYGAKKLFTIPKLKAGISYWGWGDIPYPGADWFDKNKLERTELWLPHFLERSKERYNSISDLAQLLEEELRKRIPEIDVKKYPYGDGGIHLAGYESLDEQPLPTFWHIHNGKSQALPNKKLNPAIVNANNDVPLDLAENKEGAKMSGSLIAKERGRAIIRNGDIKHYTVLWELLFKPKSPFSKIAKNTDLTFPYAENLKERAKLLKFQIQTVAGLYRFSKEGGGIGGQITMLTNSPAGIMIYSNE